MPLQHYSGSSALGSNNATPSLVSVHNVSEKNFPYSISMRTQNFNNKLPAHTHDITFLEEKEEDVKKTGEVAAVATYESNYVSPTSETLRRNSGKDACTTITSEDFTSALQQAQKETPHLPNIQDVLDDVVADVNTTKESKKDFYFRCTNPSNSDYSMENTIYTAIRPKSYAAFGVYEHGSAFYAFHGISRLDRVAETL